MPQSVSIRAPKTKDAVVARIMNLLQRELQERAQVVVTAGPADLALQLEVQPGPGPDGYAIEDDADGELSVRGHDARGLLYGVGKLLRDAHYEPGQFIPGSWRGVSVPHRPVRGIYFASHFHNYYHDAPVAEVERYVEELALWGYNVVSVWFDMHHFQGIDDSAAQAMIERLRAILVAAKRIGLDVGLVFLANEAYANSPKELRADWTAGHDGYHHPPGGHYHVELCPSQPGTLELLLRWVDEKLEAFGDLEIDYLWIWPYDQGGCTCGRCAPWGANGFLRCAEPIARRFKSRFSAGKVILSTWYFDRFTDGEWAGLDRAFQPRPDWADYLLADDYGDQYPQYPLVHGVPGDLPMVNFPEISMYRCSPWGGYGANPFPEHLQSLWDTAGDRLSGGFPYSEGIYEDLNKAICAQFFWSRAGDAWAIVREYVAYEFGQQAVAPVLEAIGIMEHNLPRDMQHSDAGYRFPLVHAERIEECWQLMVRADAQLSPRARASWRWRVLFLRALIDRELAAHDGYVSERCEKAFEELTRIYHAEGALMWVAPPTRDALAAQRGMDPEGAH